jgi:hypothetical protein
MRCARNTALLLSPYALRPSPHSKSNAVLEMISSIESSDVTLKIEMSAVSER